MSNREKCDDIEKKYKDSQNKLIDYYKSQDFQIWDNWYEIEFNNIDENNVYVVFYYIMYKKLVKNDW
jgi:hypothetical protein